jgi:flavodoxin
MKTAVVFYSLDGNCGFVAKEIQTLLNADLIRLQTKDEKKRGKAGKMLWGCGMVFSRKKPPLKPYDFDPSAYDLIIAGAPVWAGNPAPIFRTFVSQKPVTGKKVALFVCHAGGKGKSLEKFKKLFAGNEIVAEADFVTPAKEALTKDDAEVKRLIADWVKGCS